MRVTRIGLLVVSLGFLAPAASCGSESQKKKAQVERPSDGGDSSGGGGVGDASDAGAGLVGVPTGGMENVGGHGAAGTPDVLGGAASAAGGDAAAGAGSGGEGPTSLDGGAAGEGVGGAGGVAGALGAAGQGGAGGAPMLDMLFATVGSSLVRVDPETAQVTFVNTLRSPDGLTTYSDLSLAYSGVDGQALFVTPRYDVSVDLPSPALGVLDLCTGIVSDLVELTRDTGGIVRCLEGITRSSDGTWYVSNGDLTGPQASGSNKIGTLDVANRLVTNLSGTVDTAQDDMDAIFFVGAQLYGVDLASNTNSMELATVSLANGTASIVATPVFGVDATPLRLGYDDSRGKLYGWRPSDRNLVEVSLVTGQTTAIGETHTAAQLGTAIVSGITFAPPPSCD